MKAINKNIFFLLVTILLIPACDKGFDDLNTNPVRLTSIDPVFQLNAAIISSSLGYNNLTYETTIVKQMITPFVGVGTGANLNQDNRGATQGNWQTGYRSVVKNLIDGIAALEETPDRSNALSMLRIWRAYSFMVLTDTYGDIPYFEAGKAYSEGVAFPVYDAQQNIYDDILNELSNATAALSESGDVVPQDVMYDGNIGQWRKLGNSLMLRAAMRLTKANPTKAQEFAARAISGGIMESNADNAVVRHNANYRNNVGTNLNGGQSQFYYLDQDFVNFMKSKNDPRLPAIGVRYMGAAQANDQIEANANRTFDVQIGMPQGFDNSTIPPIAQADGLVSFYEYTQLDRTRIGNPEAPCFLVTYAQTLLLQAEAIARGWVSGDAADIYARAIEANMQQYGLWAAGSEIADADIQAYIAANPLEAGKEIQQINEQYWMASYLIGPEAWSNFRRTGYPEVAPNPYPGSDLKTEDFIRRLTYPDSEQTVNKANLDAAVARQGPDILDTRVWWDK